jgi:hypothetical protein
MKQTRKIAVLCLLLAGCAGEGEFRIPVPAPGGGGSAPAPAQPAPAQPKPIPEPAPVTPMLDDPDAKTEECEYEIFADSQAQAETKCQQYAEK